MLNQSDSCDWDICGQVCDNGDYYGPCDPDDCPWSDCQWYGHCDCEHHKLKEVELIPAPPDGLDW